MASEEEDTDTKLAILASLHPSVDASTIFETLIEADGSVELASERLCPQQAASTSPSQQPPKPGPGRHDPPSPRALPPAKRPRTVQPPPTTVSIPGRQLSIRKFHAGPVPLAPVRRRPARKGQTLHLYDAEDIAAHTPCSIIHDFLPAAIATALLRELLAESETFGRASFQLFERVVASPHTATFYVASAGEQHSQTHEYVYNGARMTDVRRLTPMLAQVAAPVEEAVNAEIAARIATRYPGGRKLRYQSAQRWRPNCAFVNCYDGGKESVGAHSDQLTYLGPRAVIGSLSLGVAREFRIKKIVPKDEPEPPSDEADIGSAHGNNDIGKEVRKAADEKQGTLFASLRKRKATDGAIYSSSSNLVTPIDNDKRNGESRRAREDQEEEDEGEDEEEAEQGGQISIHLPHNSLLVMHAEMQEEWKHGIAPAPSLDPHPLAGRKRLNVTYRWYRPEFHPRLTPRCRCGVPAVLRCVQRRTATRGRYMWMCHVHAVPGRAGCRFFAWAQFDDDGRPEWAWGEKGEDAEDAKDATSGRRGCGDEDGSGGGGDGDGNDDGDEE